MHRIDDERSRASAASGADMPKSFDIPAPGASIDGLFNFEENLILGSGLNLVDKAVRIDVPMTPETEVKPDYLSQVALFPKLLENFYKLKMARMNTVQDLEELLQAYASVRQRAVGYFRWALPAYHIGQINKALSTAETELELAAQRLKRLGQPQAVDDLLTRFRIGEQMGEFLHS